MKPPMNADKRRSELDVITDKIICCAYNVSNVLGCGFLEKVYENAFVVELKRFGLQVEQQYGIKVFFKEEIVGDYIADLLVNNSVIVEVKAQKTLDEIHLAQCLNYLKSTGKKVALLVNFGQPKVEIKRIVNKF